MASSVLSPTSLPRWNLPFVEPLCSFSFISPCIPFRSWSLLLLLPQKQATILINLLVLVLVFFCFLFPVLFNFKRRKTKRKGSLGCRQWAHLPKLPNFDQHSMGVFQSWWSSTSKVPFKCPDSCECRTCAHLHRVAKVESCGVMKLSSSQSKLAFGRFRRDWVRKRLHVRSRERESHEPYRKSGTFGCNGRYNNDDSLDAMLDSVNHIH